MAQESQTLSAGDLVDVRGARWRVVDVNRHDDCVACRLAGACAENRGARRTILLPFDRPRAVKRSPRPIRVGRPRWMLACRALVAERTPWDGLRGAVGAALDLIDYQLEPALAMALGHRRILIADEVGLGKTVQAGLVLADLEARLDALHALVLTPAGLCDQWMRELVDRFHLDPTLVDAGRLRQATRREIIGASPWERFSIVVASIDFAKRAEVLREVAAVSWDLLIVDEAHLSAIARERSLAVARLANRARRVVLLTGTPHPGEPGVFEALCRVGRRRGDEPIVMFRRTRAGLGWSTTRRVRLLPVRLSPLEQQMHARLERYGRQVWRETAGTATNSQARLAMIVLRKRAASGAAPLLASVQRRLRLLSMVPDGSAWQMPLPLDEAPDAIEADDGLRDACLAAPGLRDGRSERQQLDLVAELARSALADDAKARVLTRLIGRTTEPLIVFTEYRDTLESLAERIRSLTSIALLHGGLDRSARVEAARTFVDGRARVLLATDAASHGLNLHHTCRLVVNLELPWNPIRLEQRIGRVDRIGQRRSVHAIHLVARGTSEERTLARLVARVACIRETLGQDGEPEPLLPEAEVAEAVFTGRVPPGRTRLSEPRGDRESLRTPFVCLHSLGEPARAEAERLRLARSVATGRPAVAPRLIFGETAERAGAEAGVGVQACRATLDATAPWWTAIRWRPGLGVGRGLVCLFGAQIVDGRGALVEEYLLPLHVDADVRGRRVFAVDSSGGRPPMAIPALLGRIAPALLAHVERHAERRAHRLADLARARLAPLAARERLAAADDGIDASVQPGLFDRRAIRSAETAARERQRIRDAAAAQVEAMARMEEISLASPPRLLLVLAVSGPAAGLSTTPPPPDEARCWPA